MLGKWSVHCVALDFFDLISLSIQEPDQIKKKNCWHIWPGAAKPSLITLERFQNRLRGLVGVFSPHFIPFLTEETSQAYGYSVASVLTSDIPRSHMS